MNKCDCEFHSKFCGKDNPDFDCHFCFKEILCQRNKLLEFVKDISNISDKGDYLTEIARSYAKRLLQEIGEL